MGYELFTPIAQGFAFAVILPLTARASFKWGYNNGYRDGYQEGYLKAMTDCMETINTMSAESKGEER